MPDVDGDAAAAARLEALGGKGPRYKRGGKWWTLKATPPVVLAESYMALFAKGATAADVRRFLGHVLADPKDIDGLLEAGFEWSDAHSVLDVWKVAEGESPASPRSSRSGGATSKRTSKRSTASTSRQRSTKKR